MDKGLAVFFDIGDTLASAVVEGGRLSRLDVYRFIPDVLARLRAGGEGVSVSVGLISNTGDETAARMNQVLAVAIQQASACYCWLRGSCGSLFQAAGGRSWWHGGVLCPMSLACRLRRSLPSCRMACWLSGWRRRTG